VPNEISGRFPKDERMAADPEMPPPGYRRRRHADAAEWGMRRMGMVAAALGGTLLLVVGIWSIRGHGDRGVPVVQALTGPVRTKPENRGGMQVTGADASILSRAAGGEKAALAPPPEQPAPQSLRAQAEAERKAAAPGRPAASAGTLPAPPAPMEPPPAAPAAKAPQVALAVPPALPAARAKAEPSAPAAGHGLAVQLAALRSEQAAKAEWERLGKEMPALFRGRQPAMIRVEHNGHQFWRLRTGGFADRGHASTFCERVRAKGAGCAIASF